MKKNLAKRLFAGALAAAVACTTVIGSDMTALAADKKATVTKIAGSTYTTADLIWEDNFNGKELNTKYWNYEAHEPGWVNAEWQSYPSQKENEETGNIYLKDGKLVIQAKKTQNEDGTYSYTSGRVNTQNKVDTKYGRFEARIKMPSGKGFLPAFWMMPTDENLYGQWPKCGEIDITEVHGSQTDTAYSTLHFGEPHTQRQNTYTLKKGDFSEEFHVYACEWEPGEIRFYIDNKLFYTVNDWFTKKEGFDEVTYPAPFDQPYYIILNLAVGGSWVGYPDETTAFGDNAQMVVDYVKVYQKDSYNEKVEKPENTVELRDPDKNGNYVVNSSFTKAEKLNDGKNWEFLLAGTGEASAKISKKALHITTKNAGELDYSVQVVQPNIPIEQGYQYKLSFDAYADESRTMITAVTAPDNGYIRYLNDTKVKLTTKKKSYSYTFDMKSASDPNGRVEFNLGNQGSTAGVHITNVKLVQVKKISLKEAKTVRPDGNYVYNGEFQEGVDRLSYWTVKKVKGASVKVTNTNNVRRLKAVVPSSVKKVSDVTVKQTKIAVKGGKKYVLSFDAKRTSAKDQTLVVKIAGKTFKAKLTSKMKTYKFEFEPKAGTKSATLEFQLGTKGTTYIDNVRIVENGLIINGDFSAGLTGFEAWANNPSDVSYVVDTLKEDSAFCMDINNTGDQDWHIQLKQTGIKLEKGQNYKITFRAKSDLDRNIKFVFQRNGLKRKNADGSEDWTVYFSDEQIPVTNEWKTYSAVFTMKEDTDADTSMSFNFGAIGGKQITDKHTVCIDDIVLEKTDEKVEEATDEDAEDNLILNGHFTKGLSPFETWAHDSAKMESGVDNKAFYATITKTGTEDWHAQLKQTNINLEKGKYYKFSFRAKSDVNRQIKYAFQKDGNKHNDDWTVYYEKSGIALTKDWQTYTTIFQMKNDTDPESSFSFNLGAVGTLIEKQHTVMIDDVVLVPATEEEIKELKENSTTSSGGYIYRAPSSTPTGLELSKRVSEWLMPDENATSETTATGVKITITDLSGSVTQKIPTSIPTTGVGDYDKFHFQTTMKSSTAKTVTVKAMKGTSTISQKSVDLEAGASTSVTLDFTGHEIKNPTAPISLFSLRNVRFFDADEETVTIVIEMGKHESDKYTGETTGVGLPVIEIDKVSVKETSNKKDITVGNWYVYNDVTNTEASKGCIQKTDVADGVQLSIKNISSASEGWRATYESKGLDWESGYALAPGIYEFSVTGKADKDWNAEVVIGDAANDSKIYDSDVITLGEISGTHTVYLTLSEADAHAKLMIKLADITVDGRTNSGDAVVTLSKIRLTKVAEYEAPVTPDDGSGSDEQPAGTEILTNPTFADNGQGWWTTPADLAVFDCESKKATVTIAKTIYDQKENAWDIQMQTGLTFEKNHKYSVSCTLESSVERTVQVAVQYGADKGYATLSNGDKTEKLCAGEPQIITFDNAVSGDDFSNTGSFTINVGKIDGDEISAESHTITVSDVSVKDLGPISSTGDTEDHEEQIVGEHTIEIYDVSVKTKEGETAELLTEKPQAGGAWTSWINTEGGANGSISFIDDKVVADITSAGSHDYDVQIKTPTLSLEAGKTYTISFKIKSTIARTMKLAVMATGDQWYGGEEVSLTANSEYTFSKDITLLNTDSESHTNTPNILQFSLGKF